ncbi:MAG: hypothetical protein Q8L46_00925, partial [candidate division WWE3 bacterium]|nr:hypothetical protein [candidate division WWE3 bacterium]
MENQNLPAHPTPEATEGGVPRSLGEGRERKLASFASEVGPEKFIPVSEVVKRSRVSYHTLRNYTKIGLIPYMMRRRPYPNAPSTV